MFKRRFFHVVTGLIALSLILSACGSRTAAVPDDDAPILKIVSSLALTGDSKPQADAIVNGMALRVDQANRMACNGRFRLFYESWDDSSPALGRWDPEIETQNANKAASDLTVVAYLGTYNSGAAKIAIPILNQAGPLIMISPANTYPGLTRAVEGVTEPNEPDVYYPTGARNYVRLAARDDLQGPVAAKFMQSQGIQSVFILNDGEVYGVGLANAVEISAKQAGINVLANVTYDVAASDYTDLMNEIAKSNNGAAPDAIYIGAIVGNNVPKLLRQKVQILGDNQKVKFIGGDGIYTQGLVDAAGDSAEGVFAATPGLALNDLGDKGKRFYQEYAARFGPTDEPYAIMGYETMNVTLKAIENVCASGGDPRNRTLLRDAVFNIKNFDGALGTWSFDENGDITLPFFLIGQVQGGKFVQFGTYTP